MRTILLTGFYEDSDPRRRDELLECLRRNATNPLIDEIDVFVEDRRDLEALRTAYPALSTAGVRLIPHGRRVTYRELFAHAGRSHPGDRIIVANADIYFDRTLTRLDGLDLAGRLLCLSRWDVSADGSTRLFDHPASQDAWIFAAPIREVDCDFPMGVLGCDNRLAWEAERVGLAIANPARSIRALHLHLSQVRRYNPRRWLPGPTRAVPAGFLGTPWLWFVVPCMGRLDDLRGTIPTLTAQPRATCLLVDYSCPDGAGALASEDWPDVLVVPVDGRMRFRGAEARNRGAAAADDDGVLCFLDADVAAVDGLSEHLLTQLEPATFLVPDRAGPGLDSALVCRKADLDRAGGFDEVFQDWGEECLDLRAALRRAGLAERTFRAALLSHRRGCVAPAGRAGGAPAQTVRLATHAGYRRAKEAVLDQTGGVALPVPVRREIYAAVAGRYAVASAPRAGGAAVAFRERMGYTVAQLLDGVSSHNNDRRPFAGVPPRLLGLSFTQVVASVVSPVEVEFLSDGRLYVLVGTDWDGYEPAVAWLRREALKEDLPPIETRAGTAFEAWSLVGQSGQRFVLPTQVMLAAERLVAPGRRLESTTNGL